MLPRKPPIAITSPSAKTGVGMAFSVVPPACQSCLPVARSYPTTRLVPDSTACGAPPAATISGVDHVVGSSRGVRHFSLPVAASRPMTKSAPS